MNLDILIKHSTYLDFFRLTVKIIKHEQPFASGLYQHILQMFHKIYLANRKFEIRRCKYFLLQETSY